MRILGLPWLKLHPQMRLPLTVFFNMIAANIVFRLAFYFYNLGAAEPLSVTSVIHAFSIGLRFDIATICLVDGWLIFLLSLPLTLYRKPWPYRLLGPLLLILNLPILIVNGIDVIYYGTSSKRLTHELFTTKGDVGAFTVAEMLPYWWLFVLLFLTVYALFRTFRAAERQQKKEMQHFKSGRWHQWLGVLLLGGLIFVGLRGGLQRRPLRPANAFSTASLFLGNVGLNSAYTVLSSIDIGQEEPLKIVDQAKAIETIRPMFRNDFDGEFVSSEYPMVRKAEFEGPEQKYNVVLIIVESFNAKLAGSIGGTPLKESFTPNFDTLARHGRLFTNYYSNASRSVEALPALLTSFPDIFRRPLIGSSYETNATWGIANILQKRAYNTSFFCGGPNGTMGFDSYSQLAGFQKYYGWDEYPGNTENIEGNWGLHDQGVMSWMADEQASFQQPFLSTLFTISNHFPFSTPPDCPEHIRMRDIKPMEKTVMYTDWALGNYFKKVLPQAWAKNTIFIVTADHCFFGPDEPYRSIMDNFHVPLLILGPNIEPAVDNELGCHLNIMPTLIELLRLDTWHASVGLSLFSEQPRIAVNNLMGVRTFCKDNIAYSSNFETQQPGFQYNGKKWKRVSNKDMKKLAEEQELDYKLKCVYQVCNNMRVENKLIEKQWMK